MDDLKNLEKELIERLNSLETKLSKFVETNNQVLKEINKTLKNLNDLLHKCRNSCSSKKKKGKRTKKVGPFFIIRI
ncbi:hypothetical protein DRN73_08175 [Candidatus Pacearchaeota archaeon]|nr:MAG: hypothetical protein DRN73_08175 [Candidatus Pacearchaeota archaeon]